MEGEILIANTRFIYHGGTGWRMARMARLTLFSSIGWFVELRLSNRSKKVTLKRRGVGFNRNNCTLTA